MSALTDALRTALEPLKFLIDWKFDQKVDAEPGKGLSANDYTNRDKSKLDNLPTDVLTKSKQDLSDSQQEQIRSNIGAIGSFDEIFYEINPCKIYLTGTAKSSGYSFSSDKVNDLAYGCLLSETAGTSLWQKNKFKTYNYPHDSSYNPNVTKDVYIRTKYSITIGSIIQISFNNNGNYYQFKLTEASSTVRYIGNGFLYDTNLPNTSDTFCVTFDIDGTVYIYSTTRLWPGLDTSNPFVSAYSVREWSLYYNDVAYAALDPKYIPNALPDVTRTDTGKVAMVQTDGTWGLGEALTEARVNELITAALSAIPNAEEASF